jgi:hypothetical protein
MRPLPWTIRVGLFAVGFWAGLSYYKPAPASRPIIIELRLATKDSSVLLSPAVSEYLPCPKPASRPQQLLFARN